MFDANNRRSKNDNLTYDQYNKQKVRLKGPKDGKNARFCSESNGKVFCR